MIVIGTFVFGILVGCFIERHRLGMTSWSYDPNCEPTGCPSACLPSTRNFTCDSVPSKRWHRRRRRPRAEPLESELIIPPPRQIRRTRSRSRDRIISWNRASSRYCKLLNFAIWYYKVAKIRENCLD